MSNRFKTFLLLFVDTGILFFALALIAFSRKEHHQAIPFLIQHFQLFCFIFPFWILMNFIEGLYTLRTYDPEHLPVSLLRSTFLSVLVTFIGFYLLPLKYAHITPKTTLILTGVVSIPMIFWWRRFFFLYFASDNRLHGTVLIGSQQTLDLAKNELMRKPHLGYKIIAALTPEEALDFNPGPEVQLIALERNVTQDARVYNKYFALLGSGIQLMDLAKFAERISGKIPLNSINESWFVEYCGHSESRSYDVVKGMIDRLAALVMMILIFPVYLVLLPILLIVHGRPIFFTQTRTGINNKPFTLYKLRSMVVDAEKGGAQWAKPGDARITPLGKILRKTRLDELPQLINIFKGEMSLVGPRPERPEIIKDKLEPNIPFYNLRHLVKPGVTGWAQVTFRYGFSQEDSAEKLQYDLFYVKNRTLWLDLVVIIKTIKTVMTGAGQ